MTTIQATLSLLSGSVVGFTLGLIGGGGSVLAVPLLVYIVGVKSPHVAIGTSAVAVALSAAANLVGHARASNVKWSCALAFALSGIVGASAGAQLGKLMDGGRLLSLFGILMIVVGIVMLFPRRTAGNPDVTLSRDSARTLLPRLAIYGLAVGLLSGFFGIGGGFLIVPGLMGATAMPLINAIGSSLVSVTAFGLTTAGSYAWSGLVDWQVAFFFVVGGAIGGLAGLALNKRLSRFKRGLHYVFSGVIILVGCYVLIRAFL